MKKYSIISICLMLFLLLSSSKSSENVLPKKYVSIHPEVKKDSLQMAVNQATREAWQSFVNRSSD